MNVHDILMQAFIFFFENFRPIYRGMNPTSLKSFRWNRIAASWRDFIFLSFVHFYCVGRFCRATSFMRLVSHWSESVSTRSYIICAQYRRASKWIPQWCLPSQYCWWHVSWLNDRWVRKCSWSYLKVPSENMPYAWVCTINCKHSSCDPLFPLEVLSTVIYCTVFCIWVDSSVI